MRSVEHVSGIKELRNVYKISLEKAKGKRLQQSLKSNESNKYSLRKWAGFFYVRIMPSGEM
jgi:hypothetical protein